jgi:hypothetical protein
MLILVIIVGFALCIALSRGALKVVGGAILVLVFLPITAFLMFFLYALLSADVQAPGRVAATPMGSTWHTPEAVSPSSQADANECAGPRGEDMCAASSPAAKAIISGFNASSGSRKETRSDPYPGWGSQESPAEMYRRGGR